MGVCNGKEAKLTPEAKERAQRAKEKTKELNFMMQDDQQAQQQIHKLLLLGAGESGKSTLFKQMINIYGDGFSVEERERTYKPIIYLNIINCIQTLIENTPKFGGGPIQTPQDSLEAIAALKGHDNLTEDLCKHISAVWHDSSVQEAYDNRNLFQLKDSASYFLSDDRLMEIGKSDYVPNQQDVLRSRVKTTGIVENDFTIEGNKFKFFDVGGQRSERRKWIHCFEDVTALLFVGVLSEYDLVLCEDENTNRMEETLNLFDSTINSRWFRDTAVILFLNKKDLFKEKLQITNKDGSLRHPLTACPIFEDYPEEINDYDTGCKAILQQFEERSRDPEKAIFPHITCATDTGHIAVLFDGVRDIVIRESLRQAGLV